MNYRSYTAELAGSIDALVPRAQAGVFWVLGAGLDQCMPAVSAPWRAWLDDAKERGWRFATTGRVDEDDAGAWRRMEELSSVTAKTEEMSQHLESTLICVSGALDAGINETRQCRGAWADKALSAVFECASLELFEDVAFPGLDDELDEVFATDLVQAAARFCQRVVATLACDPEPSPAVLAGLLADAHVLCPPTD